MKQREIFLGVQACSNFWHEPALQRNLLYKLQKTNYIH